jgi:hypothetical protein
MAIFTILGLPMLGTPFEAILIVICNEPTFRLVVNMLSHAKGVVEGRGTLEED